MSINIFLYDFYGRLFKTLLRQHRPVSRNQQTANKISRISKEPDKTTYFPQFQNILFQTPSCNSNHGVCITQFIIQLSTMQGGVAHHAKNMKAFAVLLVALEVIIITLYGVFVRIEKPEEISNDLNSNRYPAFQDVNVMMLIGFGFLMAFSKSFSWSAISYTFFMNALLVQLYILLSAFWKRVLSIGFNAQNYYIYITEEDFTLGLYSAASMFITLGCFVGRVGPLECLIMCVFHQIGFTLNEAIFEYKIHAFDVGGSMVIHAFGAYSGLALSLILSSLSKPNSRPASNYFSNVFAFVGTLFLWMFWPSFNFGAFAQTAFTKSQIIINTILSLTGSCLSTFAVSAFLKEKFTMEYLLNATLAGGVIIGAAAGLITSLGGSMAIGLIGGVISTLGYRYLTPYLQEKIGLYDTCGVHNLHGIQGLLGGIISAIVAASYYYPSSMDAYSMNSTDFPEYATLVSEPFKQGGRQIAATFTSIGIGIVTSLICGIFLRMVYSFNQKEFFTDAVYFEEAEEFIEQLQYHHAKPSAKPPQPAPHQPYQSPAMDTSDKMMSEEVHQQL